MISIILHLFAWIEICQIGLRVHKAMHKENSWTLSKSTKHIKIINKILLQYYHNIFRPSFGYGIFKGKNWSLYEPNCQTFFRRHKRGILWCSTSYNPSWNLYSIKTGQKVHVSNIVFYIQ